MSASQLLRSLLLCLLLSQSHASSFRFRRGGGNGSHPDAPRCRATPGSDDWPSEGVWAAFNQSLGGQLIRPSPPGAVCHPGEPTYDPDNCPAVAAGWSTYDFHSIDPISSMWNQYNNDSCLPNVTYPCSPAGYPAYTVNATTAEHVKLSFEYAFRNNLRIVVKSTGHDYQGRSTAPGALSVWIHHMQGLAIHQSSFQPKGCRNVTINGTAVTAAGGTQMISLYEELDKINQTIVGGGGKTVAVGGYITGGGHSILAPRYGLAADQVLEMEVVTPKGDIVTANECQNQDLFWAMRGGGGSTFGVATSITMATHPTPQIVTFEGAFATYNVSAPWFWDMVGYVLSQYPYLDSKGVSGYGSIVTNFPNPFDNGTTRISAFALDFIIQNTQDPAAMQAIWKPILAHVNQTWPEAVTIANSTAYPSFSSWFADHFDSSSAGEDLYVGSHLMDEEAFVNPAALTRAFKTFSSPSGGSNAYLVAGKGVHDAKPRGGGDSVCPAWRNALVHATNGALSPPLDPEARKKTLADLNAAVAPVRQLAPTMGAYVNENNPAEPDWQHSFWGQNYNRLASIKRVLDPYDTLWCHPCVGNEGWEEVGYQLCRKDQRKY